jgi:hypothetical protein
MPTVSDTPKGMPPDSASLAQDAFRRFVDDSTALGRSVFAAWSAASQASLQASFELQNASLQASRALMDSGVKASNALLDQATDSVRKGQEATTRIVTASLNLADSAWLNRKQK